MSKVIRVSTKRHKDIKRTAAEKGISIEEEVEERLS